MRAPISLSLLPILALAACSGGPRPAAPAPVAVAPAPAPAPLPAPMPKPPAGAAANLTVPMRLADGSYATPNRQVSDAGAIWHMRSALNVAVLTCPQSPELAAQYNGLLRTHRAALKQAHSGLAAEYRVQDFDAAMTRLYNYFSQPPAQRAFCPAAASLLERAGSVPAAEFVGFARAALAQLDAPFTDFYRAYDGYRADLAAWRAGEASAAPRIAYDGGDFLRDDDVAGGESARQVATR